MVVGFEPPKINDSSRLRKTCLQDPSVLNAILIDSIAMLKWVFHLGIFVLLRTSLALLVSRRQSLVFPLGVPLLSSPAVSEAIGLETKALGRQEYTNSITASRDTNISPAEAYDVILERIPERPGGVAADLGAGAGLSTSLLYKKGYTNLFAVDWSKTAWDDSVTDQPDSVSFYEMDDASFFRRVPAEMKFDCIVYNFAINTNKAVLVAKDYLKDDGVLLAPCNDRQDYWYKQSYLLLDKRGNEVWKSGPVVGAWDVQFQPDVTSKTCTGVWCGGFNGFQQQ